MPHYVIPVKLVSYGYMNIESNSLQEAIEKVKQKECSENDLREVVANPFRYEYNPDCLHYESDENNKTLNSLGKGE